MKLASKEQVLARMNLTNTVSAASAPTIDSALEAATPIIESLLRTPLVSAERVDYFDYDISIYNTFVPFHLYLSQGYLNAEPIVYRSTAGVAISDLSTATVMDKSEYVIDYRRGKITILIPVDAGFQVLAIKYSAGYDEGDEEIPSHIVQAAIAASVFLINTQTVASGKKKETQISAKSVAGVVSVYTNPYVITPFDGTGPSRSTVL